jgi:hypothetical protein
MGSLSAGADAEASASGNPVVAATRVTPAAPRYSVMFRLVVWKSVIQPVQACPGRKVFVGKEIEVAVPFSAVRLSVEGLSVLKTTLPPLSVANTQSASSVVAPGIAFQCSVK